MKGSTLWYLPALAYASDRHVDTWLMWLVLCLQCVCHKDMLHPNIHRNFIWIIIEIYINPDDIINSNLILPFFCRGLIYYWIIIIYYWIIIIYYWIIIYYYYNPRININPSCPVWSMFSNTLAQLMSLKEKHLRFFKTVHSITYII